MNVFVGLEFDDSEPAVTSAGKQINHSTIGGRKGRNLRIDITRIESRVQQADAQLYFRFQPSLRLHAPQWMLLVPLGSTQFAKTPHQIVKQWFGEFAE